MNEIFAVAPSARDSACRRCEVDRGLGPAGPTFIARSFVVADRVARYLAKD